MKTSGNGNWIKRYFWVIFADVIGLAWLISLLLAANGAPALKPMMLALMMLVPITGLLITLASRRPHKTQPVPVAATAARRTIFIAPRPDQLRAS